MPVLAPGQPITTGEPRLLVENQLAPGRYRFRLTVVDDGGLESDPAELIVTVFEVPRPERPPGPIFRPDLGDRVFRVQPGLAGVIKTRRFQ